LSILLLKHFNIAGGDNQVEEAEDSEAEANSHNYGAPVLDLHYEGREAGRFRERAVVDVAEHIVESRVAEARTAKELFHDLHRGCLHRVDAQDRVLRALLYA